MAVSTPITIPSTVKKLRNLWPRILSSAIPSVSRNELLGILNLSFSASLIATLTITSPQSGQQLGQVLIL